MELEFCLKDKQHFLESVFNAIQDGIIVLDQDFSIVQTNRWMEEKYAAKMPLIGKKCYTVFKNGQEYCIDCPYIQALETGKPHTQIVSSPSTQSNDEWFE